jgi:hypothetical protein
MTEAAPASALMARALQRRALTDCLARSRIRRWPVCANDCFREQLPRRSAIDLGGFRRFGGFGSVIA